MIYHIIHITGKILTETVITVTVKSPSFNRKFKSLTPKVTISACECWKTHFYRSMSL